MTLLRPLGIAALCLCLACAAVVAWVNNQLESV